MSPLFAIVAVVWGLVMAYIGVKGIQYVAKLATYLAVIPLLMILVVFFNTWDGISSYVPADPQPFLAFAMLIQIVIGFFATAGAAGADFGMNSRNTTDVKWGGLVGISLAIVYAGGLPLLSIAGAHGANPALESFAYDTVIGSIGGFLASSMFLLFAFASVAPACFCAFIAGNSFSTMIPGVPRMASTMVGASIAIVLAITGVAENLIGFFTIVGASFGPIIGAMVADYVLSGRKWAGPREGINFAGYGAWAVGFVVGILPFLPVPEVIKTNAQPVVLYSLIVGFVVYVILAKLGLEPKAVKVETAAA